MSLNPVDDEALKRIINYPARGIGETTINKLTRAAIDNKVSLWTIIKDVQVYNPGLNSAAIKKLGLFHDLIDSFVQLNASGADAVRVATRIISDTQLLTILVSDRTPESISKQENLEELINGVKEFVSNRMEEGNEAISLSDFLGEVSLATDQDTQDGTDTEERVTLMTVHAAKGLEFSNVFIVGVEEELFPSSMSSDTLSGVEEERRLLYVAITRAKRFCMMSYASSRFRNGQTMICSPSRFLRDIDISYLHMTNGTQLTTRQAVNPMEQYRSSFHSATTSPKAPWNRPMRNNSVPTQTQRSTSAPARTPSSGGDVHTASELAVDMEISHSRFGHGIITSIDTSQTDTRITVEFDNTGSKLLLLKFAKFTIIK